MLLVLTPDTYSQPQAVQLVTLEGMLFLWLFATLRDCLGSP